MAIYRDLKRLAIVQLAFWRILGVGGFLGGNGGEHPFGLRQNGANFGPLGRVGLDARRNRIAQLLTVDISSKLKFL